jgi:hypothetical protein
MANSEHNTHELTNVLKTFISAEELLDLKKVVSLNFVQKAREEADKLINNGTVNLEDLEKASEEIINDRGRYLKKIRSKL